MQKPTAKTGWASVVIMLSFALAGAVPASAAQSAWELQLIALDGRPVALELARGKKRLSRVRILLADGTWRKLSDCASGICAKPLSSRRAAAHVPKGALPDAVVSTGRRNIHRAWLAGPTKRYGHGVLGDAVEAESLVAVDRLRRAHHFRLDLQSVFEDRHARIADVDDDGEDEIVVVRSYLDRGAALAVVELGTEGLKLAAETRPIGLPHRWLNPAGIADFDGDGKTEIAIVVTPHIGGRLEFWRYDGRTLRRKMSLRGFSNHFIGSRVQNMSAAADLNGDKQIELALPSADRRTLRIVSYTGGKVAEPGRIGLPGEVVTQIVAVRVSRKGGVVLVFGLSTGALAIVSYKSN